MSQPAVCHGAPLGCSQGSAPGGLVVTPHSAGTGQALHFATVDDAQPLRNITPFGLCLSPTHPLAATGAAPCVPQTAGCWQLRAPAVRYQGKSALRSDATLSCQLGGVIRVLHSGQGATALQNSEEGG